jgi:homoserine dehydrogenase
VGGGTPVLLFLYRLHHSQGIKRIDAALNTTLGYVCSQVTAGVSIPMAVQHAQQAGWAEPNPTLDLDGTDAYAKAVIIHNLLFSSKDPLRLDGDRPRLNLEEERIRQLARSGRTPLVISTITPGRIALAVVGARAEGGGSDAVGLVRVRAVLRGGSEASIVGPGAGPRVTAGALMGDLRALSEGGEARPWGVIP